MKLYSPLPKFRSPELKREGRGEDCVATAWQGVVEDNAVNDRYTQGALQPVPLGFWHKWRFVIGWPELLWKSQLRGTGSGTKMGFTLVSETGNSNPKKLETVVPGGTTFAVGSKAVTKQEFPLPPPVIGSGFVAV